MKERKHWLLRLVLPGRFGKLATGILLLCLLLPLFHLSGEYHPSDPTPSLFFSLIIAYIIPVFSHITQQSAEALQRLRPLLALNDDAFAKLQDSLYLRSVAMLVFDSCFGALCGFMHLSFVVGSSSSAFARLIPGAPGFASMVGALLVWIIMTNVISTLIQQASVFAGVGRHHVRLSPFNIHSLLPFGRVSISSSLSILGALTLFPLIGLEIGVDLLEIIPGAIAILIPLIVMLVLPVWPVHQRLAAMKEEQLGAVNGRIDDYLAHSHSDDAGIDLNPRFTSLLIYRRETADTATWPLDVSNVTKLSLYLVIPPLTWVAAALMENLVDAML